MFNTVLKIKDKEYICKLSAKACINAEKRLGTNPLNVFYSAGEGKIPKLGDLLIILHASLEKDNHGITMDNVYDMYDDYCEEGGDIMSLVEFILQIFTDSGFVQKEEETISEKN